MMLVIMIVVVVFGILEFIKLRNQFIAGFLSLDQYLEVMVLRFFYIFDSEYSLPIFLLFFGLK